MDEKELRELLRERPHLELLEREAGYAARKEEENGEGPGQAA